MMATAPASERLVPLASKKPERIGMRRRSKRPPPPLMTDQQSNTPWQA
ncbi:hypothetical protein ABH853_07015 [Pseudomonas sp. 13.2]|uniref:Uncharacterized protein n=1 Tax=Pseudomonas sp. 13.2 TaxID=3144665 RepID=A0AAU7BKB3_9PSED